VGDDEGRPGAALTEPRWVLSQPPLTADLSWLPALNLGTREAAIWTRSPVRGFTPCRAALLLVLNLPNPVNDTSPPPRSVSVIVSMNASTAFAASRLFS